MVSPSSYANIYTRLYPDIIICGVFILCDIFAGITWMEVSGAMRQAAYCHIEKMLSLIMSRLKQDRKQDYWTHTKCVNFNTCIKVGLKFN